MSTYVDSPFEISIVMLEVLVFPIHTLTHGSFEEIREHKHYEIEDVLLLIIVTEIKEVKRQHFLEHIMQQEVVTSDIKS